MVDGGVREQEADEWRVGIKGTRDHASTCYTQPCATAQQPGAMEQGSQA